MKKNLTEMVFILDKSGSMHHLTEDTIGGFNSLIDKQRLEPGEAYVTTVLFDDRYRKLHDHVNIQDVKPITNNEYHAGGCTALLDAVGSTIDSVGKRLSETPEEERPEKVVFVIVTDGEENSSIEFSKSKVKEMIEHQQSKYSWIFMFLGANIDAVSEASNLGINMEFARTYSATEIGTQSVYDSVTCAMSAARSCACCIDQAEASKAISNALDSIV